MLELFWFVLLVWGGKLHWGLALVTAGLIAILRAQIWHLEKLLRNEEDQHARAEAKAFIEAANGAFQEGKADGIRDALKRKADFYYRLASK